jgi:hypothetical protein
VREYAVEASASILDSPPRIEFQWVSDPAAAEYFVYEKSVNDTAWGDPVAVLPGNATSWTDDAFAAGEAREYSFRKTRGLILDTLAIAPGTEVVFIIKDSWGDGICCSNGLGLYEVSGCGNVYASGGAFASVESTSFVAGPPENPCGVVVVKIVLDLYGQETTWKIIEKATGVLLAGGGPYSPPKFGHLLAGAEVPEEEGRGTVLLLVHEPLAAPLQPELVRLETDMIRDGFRVVRRDVPSTATVPEVKDLIVSEREDDSTVTTVCLLGHVAVPYSGDVHGVHADQTGAWPADLYYGELDGPWTDSIVNNTSATRPENHNVPGDGKFDQTFLPSDVDLEVGRVDLSDLPAFDEDEIALMRRYLDKNHAFRSGAVALPRRGIIDDNAGVLYGTAYACVGWRNFTAMFGQGGAVAGNWVPDLQQNGYLFAYGCGPSSYTGCGGVASTQDFANRVFHSVFTMLMGSYFGDWDNPNNVLRAPLASEGEILACSWAGFPPWHLHRMALGGTIGASTRLSQNNWTLYTIGCGGRGIHTALMGDPTLRMHVVRPVSSLSLDALAPGRVRVSWSPPPDPVVGYHVYRADSLHGAFTRLNGDRIADTVFTDEAAPDRKGVYMVRAVKLEPTGSGSYYNLSPGAIDSIDVVTGVGDSRPPATLRGAPNPFGRTGEIRYALPERTHVRVCIYDASGRLVRELVSGVRDAGAHAVTWDRTDDRGREIASGVYFLSMKAGGATIRKKLVVVR